LLKCIEVSKGFGGLQALKKVDLAVGENSITGLVGPNGSGKSTLLNVISGVYRPDSGKVIFADKEISGLPPYTICSLGVTKTSQTVQSFPEMTAVENVLTSVLFRRKDARVEKDSKTRARELRS
jgi:branched-chain amino acid transport system ATP-binding protein